MTKKSNLESGFLFLYDWLPAIEQLPAKEVKKLFLALVARQRENTPLPLFSNTITASYARMIEPCIKRRLDGQIGGNKAHEATTPTVGTSPQSKVKQSKEKKQKSNAEQSNSHSKTAHAWSERRAKERNSSFDAEDFFEAAVKATYRDAIKSPEA